MGGIKRSSRIQVDAECIIIYSACNQRSLWSSSFCLYPAAADDDPVAVVADYLGSLVGWLRDGGKVIEEVERNVHSL